jgi:O-antigen/teichoic acid export membrane protein
MSRLIKSKRNVSVALGSTIATIIIGFFAQRVLLNSLGAEYLGINGLFTSIVSMLALAELGLGSAIYFHLYKPFSKNDTSKVKSIINFYKNGYRLVALIVLILGLLIVPFLKTIVGGISISESIYIIYFLFLFDVIASYLLTYKRAVLYVDQNNYIISSVHLAYLIILNALQIAILILTKNFYLYLIIKIVMRLAENIVLTLITDRKYPYLTDGPAVKLDASTKEDIYKKVRGLSYHKVASYIVLGTDNILISVFLGVAVVGLYSNYLLVTTAILMLMGQAFTAITASVGNLLVDNNSSKSFDVYKKIRFMNFWLACFATTSLLVLMNSFISLWVGAQYLLPIGVLMAICLNLYLTMIRASISSFKEAAGIFHEDRFVPVIESIANLIFSVAFLKVFGLAGIFLGTACSTLILHLYSYPKFVNKPLFKMSNKDYYYDFFSKLLIVFFISAATFTISRTIPISSTFYKFIFNTIICIVLPNALLYLIYRNSEELSYYRELILKTTRVLSKKVS